MTEQLTTERLTTEWLMDCDWTTYLWTTNVTEQLTTEHLMDRTTNTFLAGVQAKKSYNTYIYTLHIQDALNLAAQDARNLEQDDCNLAQDARNLEQDDRNLAQDARTTLSLPNQTLIML